MDTSTTDPLILAGPEANRRTTIVIDVQASLHLRSVAHELGSYLRAVTGADRGVVGTKIDVATNAAEVDGSLILLGPSRYTDGIGIDAAALPSEAFRIKRIDDRLVLFGADDTAVRHAAYWFLENICGVRWFWPGPYGEDIPTYERLTIDELDITCQPSFRMRVLGGLSGAHEENDWARHHRLGGSLAVHGVHSWGKMVPPDVYGPQHPEYFALKDGEHQWRDFNGKHGCQLCTTHPDVIDRCIRYVRHFFDTHPAGLAFNISPNDGGGFCECPRCQALSDGRLCRCVGDELPSVSGQIFTFANEIAQAVKQSHPDRYLVILAYHEYLEPPARPDFRLCDNIIVQFCVHCDFDTDPQWRRQTEATFQQWTDVCNHRAVYEYLVWRGNAELPRSLTATLPAALRGYHHHGVRLFYSQMYDDFGPSGVNYYLTAKLLWDIDADTEAILSDYYERCFGPAAETMRRHDELLEERWRHAVATCGTAFYPGSPVYYLEMFPDDVLGELDHLLTEAHSQTRQFKHTQRIERFRQLLTYTRATMNALHAMQQLQAGGVCELDRAWPSTIASRPQAQQSRFKAEWEATPACATPGVAPGANQAEALHLLDKALQAWQARSDTIERLRDSGIIDYWHLRRDVDADYRFDPSEQLRAIKRSLVGA